jgi:hypothetical protein
MPKTFEEHLEIVQRERSLGSQMPIELEEGETFEGFGNEI